MSRTCSVAVLTCCAENPLTALAGGVAMPSAPSAQSAAGVESYGCVTSSIGPWCPWRGAAAWAPGFALDTGSSWSTLSSAPAWTSTIAAAPIATATIPAATQRACRRRRAERSNCRTSALAVARRAAPVHAASSAAG